MFKLLCSCNRYEERIRSNTLLRDKAQEVDMHLYTQCLSTVARLKKKL